MAMLRRAPHPHLSWGAVQRASFGLICGTILGLNLLRAMDEVFAEVLSRSMETGERILTRKALGAAWKFAIHRVGVAEQCHAG
ncbi:hypothetical protein [Roseivivax isoporae]|uniref:Uncharacterized protein n=1 Tax=Roseivivax isoporae LMG 25204 TaxID=1449351 RepID=X7F1V8_9RHOB|nr:hypothetical protein [Roseivivax isoporae]ETX26738.1 hypothetical protein RISW2_19430 [Roseivivax isoporae LMG 25204]